METTVADEIFDVSVFWPNVCTEPNFYKKYHSFKEKSKKFSRQNLLLSAHVYARMHPDFLSLKRIAMVLGSLYTAETARAKAMRYVESDRPDDLVLVKLYKYLEDMKKCPDFRSKGFDFVYGVLPPQVASIFSKDLMKALVEKEVEGQATLFPRQGTIVIRLPASEEIKLRYNPDEYGYFLDLIPCIEVPSIPGIYDPSKVYDTKPSWVSLQRYLLSI